MRGLAGVVGEWGGLYLVTSEPSLIHMSEKDLHSKFQLLFKKNQFDIAIRLTCLVYDNLNEEIEYEKICNLLIFYSHVVLALP